MNPLVFILLIFFCLQTKSNESLPNSLEFNVYRNSSLIGYHNISFSESNNSLRANIEIKFEVTFLGFTVYDYYHKNEEIWLGDKLLSLKSTTDKNGEKMSCDVNQTGSKYDVNGSSRNIKLTGPIVPTSYWKNEIISEDKKETLNTQDCGAIIFTVTSLGEKMIYNNKILTDHYKLKGKESSGEDVLIDIWYDKFGRWSKMIFVKDGSEIEYIDKKFDLNND